MYMYAVVAVCQALGCDKGYNSLKNRSVNELKQTVSVYGNSFRRVNIEKHYLQSLSHRRSLYFSVGKRKNEHFSRSLR